MRSTIIYHKEDNDGVFSCGIVVNYLEKTFNDNSIEFIPSTYNSLLSLEYADLIDICNNCDKLFILDISFNDLDKMEFLYETMEHDNFVWCDHHKPIIDASVSYKFGRANGIRDTKSCTIINVWRYFNNPLLNSVEDNIPLLYKYLDAWDAWCWEKYNFDGEIVRDINKGVSVKTKLNVSNAVQVIKNINEYNEFECIMNSFGNIGNTVNSVQDNDNTFSVLNFGDGSWIFGGESAIMITDCKPTSSRTFDAVKDKYQHGIVAKRMNDGRWTISVYNLSNTDMHVGEYLKENYNGGGHKGAAGCQLTENQFIQILTQRMM